jgi:hypothetical protein
METDRKVLDIISATGVSTQRAKDLLLQNSQDVQKAIAAHKKSIEPSELYAGGEKSGIALKARKSDHEGINRD